MQVNPNKNNDPKKSLTLESKEVTNILLNSLNTLKIYIITQENLAFYPFFKKNLAICPCFQTIQGRAPVSKLNFIKIELCLIKLKKKKKKKKKKARNLILGRQSSKTPLQGLKTSLQGSLNLVWGDHTYKKKIAGKRHYRALKRHYRAP